MTYIFILYETFVWYLESFKLFALFFEFKNWIVNIFLEFVLVDKFFKFISSHPIEKLMFSLNNWLLLETFSQEVPNFFGNVYLFFATEVFIHIALGKVYCVIFNASHLALSSILVVYARFDKVWWQDESSFLKEFSDGAGQERGILFHWILI